MVEVPSVAFVMDLLCGDEVDFFSIGSNDLTQYFCWPPTGTTPRSRNAVLVGPPRGPAAAEAVVDGAHARGKWVGLCGELADVPAAFAGAGRAGAGRDQRGRPPHPGRQGGAGRSAYDQCRPSLDGGLRLPHPGRGRGRHRRAATGGAAGTLPLLSRRPGPPRRRRGDQSTRRSSRSPMPWPCRRPDGRPAGRRGGGLAAGGDVLDRLRPRHGRPPLQIAGIVSGPAPSRRPARPAGRLGFARRAAGRRGHPAGHPRCRRRRPTRPRSTCGSSPSSPGWSCGTSSATAPGRRRPGPAARPSPRAAGPVTTGSEERPVHRDRQREFEMTEQAFNGVRRP